MTKSIAQGYYKTKKTTNRMVIVNVSLMILFFTSTDTLIFGTNANKVFLYVPRIVGLLLFLSLPILLAGNKIRFNNQTILLIFFVGFVALSGFVNNSGIGTMLSRMIAIMVAYSISKYCKLREFILVYCKFVYIISIIAIVMEFLAYVFPPLICAFPKITNTAGVEFFTCFLGSLEARELSKGLIRATGIFWEPGAFAFYINIAIFFQIFVLKQQRSTQLIIYTIALVITYSTAGYICFAFLIATYLFFYNIKAKNSKYKKVIVGLFFVLLMLLVSVPGVKELLFGKIINAENTTMVRWYSLIGGFKIALNSPIFGVFSNNIENAMLIFNSASGGMLTNTWTYQFAAYGIPFGIFFTLCSYRFFVKFKFSKILTLFLFIFLLLSYVGEMFFSYFPFIFVFYGLRENDENCSNKYIA